MDDRAWMTPAELDDHAEFAALDHRQFLIGMVGTLASVFERPNARTPQARADLTKALSQQLQSRYRSASIMLEALTKQAIAAGVGQVGIDSLGPEPQAELEQLVGEATSQLLDEILSIMAKDSVTVRRAWRQFATEATFMAPGMGSGANHWARIGKIGDLKFRQMDRAGRQWESAIMVRTMVRQHLLRTQVESALYAIQQVGLDLARATWGDDDIRADVVFSISGVNADEDIASYIEIRDSIFHPNSTARVEVA